MKRLLLLAALLTSCALTPTPPADTVTVLGIPVRWHVATSQAQINAAARRPPGTPVLGVTHRNDDGSCDIWLRSDAVHYAGVVAHEFGHCQALPEDGSEKTAMDYGRLYLDTCGESVAPLGLPDTRPAMCSEPPRLRGHAPPERLSR